MKFFTKYHKRLRITRLKAAFWIVVVCIFLMPSYVKFEKTGDNMFTVFLDGINVGVVGDVSDIDPILMKARAEVAKGYSEVVLADAEITYKGSEVISGKINDANVIKNNMIQVLEDNRKQTLLRSYTVKIDDFSVNLASADEVLQLLRASLAVYDTDSKYDVELNMDPERELNVLAATVDRKTTTSEQKQANVDTGAGFESALNTIFSEVEPQTEKDFADYEQGLINLSYANKVEVVESYLPADELTDIDTAIQTVTKEQEQNQIYVVASGDTLSQIAEKNNLTMEKLISLNNLESENTTIRVGDELIITVPEPELSVDRVEQSYYEETYDADIIYEDNDQWFTTQTQTLQEPSSGYRKVIADITYRNAFETGREIVKEEIVMEAVPKIVERGTITPPTYIKPLSGGVITSGFGKRVAPTRGASTYHKGIDFSTPKGTSVFASNAGVVVRAGWGSGYGYVVYIDHSDGRETRYGHLSKILVKVGQTVAQGEKIALSGNTGVSTGPHLHFEILINGVQVNPLNYLDN